MALDIRQPAPRRNKRSAASASTSTGAEYKLVRTPTQPSPSTRGKRYIGKIKAVLCERQQSAHKRG
jgi:hypothetical protein